MTPFERRPVESCRYDVVSLGEVMLRLDPGEGRIRSARTFAVHEGGGEYNVARGCARCFGLRAGVLTALVDNEVGRLVEELVRAAGVGTGLVRWVDHDGVGRSARNGLNFVERGFGLRSAVGVSDRGHTAVGALRPEDLDLEHLFGTLGVRWLHTGGVFAALSESTPAVVEEVMTVARRHGTIVSYDVNYRPSLWASAGGAEAARAMTDRLAAGADVVFGDVDPGTGNDRPAPDLDQARERFVAGVDAQRARWPRARVIATTLRVVRSASANDWGGAAWSAGAGVTASVPRHVEVLDRVGSGDAFAAGVVAGLLGGDGVAAAVELGAGHGALVHTTAGDGSDASEAEVRALLAGGGAAVRR